jgi:hypothetical protein
VIADAKVFSIQSTLQSRCDERTSFFPNAADCPSGNRNGYKAILVDEDEYLLGLVRYIHHTPLKAGMVKKLKEYEWGTWVSFRQRGLAAALS